MSSSQSELQREYRQIVGYFRTAAVVSAAVLTTGSIFYHAVEKLSWLDSIYFSVITLATVGYGDITPHTSAGKIFTIGYVLAGIGIIATLANLTIKRSLLRRELKKKQS